MNNVSVIIPNYNGLNYLKKLFSSLETQEYIEEIIIVDNGSSDGSIDFIHEKYPHYVLIENEKNLGFAAAINQGIEVSKGDYLFLLNNDMELEKNCISNLLKTMENNPNIFAVSSKMVQYHDRTKMDDAGDEYTVLGWTKRVGYGKSRDKYNDSREIFSACAGASLYRKQIFEEIGYFDENFFAYLEDIDISYRALIQGYINIYCPGAVVYHVGSGTSGSRYNEFKIQLAARNNIYIPYKNMPWPQLTINLLFLLMGFFIKYLFFLKAGKGPVYLKGLKEGLNSLDKIDKVNYQSKNLENYLKIEWLLIKNTIKFLFF
ncbi:glycosyltransferase family 2 protein [Methanobacterium alcaliphilum]|uniref:glycosyltransferase family 2 protein n=1 Tax=Methanobacterium alcaliphilum TaxID=392018 RepID=UPI00200A8AB5|nr:glycosyltransferase family 2 protein [Methanobacterium alcaliphilum]MCK9152244.1 glycosyltransferase family 2 protein [Methanobacterium alcaliphilum]